MDKQQEIVQMLWDESFNSTQMRCNFVKSDDFEDLAERIVKLFSIPDVVGQSEQLPPRCLMDMPDSKYCDCCNECKWCENIIRR